MERVETRRKKGKKKVIKWEEAKRNKERSQFSQKSFTNEPRLWNGRGSMLVKIEDQFS